MGEADPREKMRERRIKQFKNEQKKGYPVVLALPSFPTKKIVTEKTETLEWTLPCLDAAHFLVWFLSSLRAFLESVRL